MATQELLTINGGTFPYPTKFSMQRVPNIVAEMRTMSGRDVADVNGWKWADTTINWGAMPPDEAYSLCSSLHSGRSGSFAIVFKDIDQQVKTVNAILKSFTYGRMKYQNDGKAVFEDIAATLSFPDCYS